MALLPTLAAVDSDVLNDALEFLPRFHRTLIECPANIVTTHHFGQTTQERKAKVFLKACKCNHAWLIDICGKDLYTTLTSRYDPDRRTPWLNRYRRSPIVRGIWHAIDHGHAELLDKLSRLKGYDSDEALIAALANRNTSLIDWTRVTNRHYAGLCGGGYIQELSRMYDGQQHAVSIDYDQIGTGLMLACKYGRREVVRMLYDRGQIGHRTQCHRWAVKYGHTDILLSLGKTIIPGCLPDAVRANDRGIIDHILSQEKGNTNGHGTLTEHDIHLIMLGDLSGSISPLDDGLYAALVYQLDTDLPQTLIDEGADVKKVIRRCIELSVYEFSRIIHDPRIAPHLDGTDMETLVCRHGRSELLRALDGPRRHTPVQRALIALESNQDNATSFLRDGTLTEDDLKRLLYTATFDNLHTNSVVYLLEKLGCPIEDREGRALLCDGSYDICDIQEDVRDYLGDWVDYAGSSGWAWPEDFALPASNRTMVAMFMDDRVGAD